MATEHSVRKTYSLSEMELWSERIFKDWESIFGESELEYGRKLYKSGAVYELEMESCEAKVCVRIDGVPMYTIIEFTKNSTHWRGSTSDKFTSAAIAVAGFYEIEELVVDYVVNDPFFEEAENNDKPAETNSEEEKKEEISDDQNKRPQMRLCLNFSSERKGLRFQAKWIDADNKQIPAFGEKCVPIAQLYPDETGALIRLANLARKAGFKYENESYLLSEILKIPMFLKNQFSEWKKYFVLKKNKKVDALKLGEQLVQLRPIACELDANGGDFDVRWSPSVGDMPIEDADFQKILRGTTSLSIVPKYGIVKVSMRDALFVRDVENSREFGFAEGMIPRYMLLALSDFGEKIGMSAELSTWMNSLISEEQNNIFELSQFLRPYQKKGAAWAYKLFKHGCNALIADEMGLGKTVQSLTIIDRLKSENPDGKFLVVCPASVIPVWVSETNKFYPNIKCGILGAKSVLKDADLWISSYNQLRRNERLLAGTEFEMAILDEAQFIKNPDAKTTRVCWNLKSKKRLALTGTPIENRLMDMWSVFRWLMPGLLGSRTNFENLLSSDSSSDLVKSIRRQISPFSLRRLKSEVASELPEKLYVDLACPMSELQRAEYDKLVNQTRECLMTIANQSSGKITVLSLLTRLRQVACDAALLPWIGNLSQEYGGKISVMADKVEELFQSGKKILIFSQFTKFLDLIRTAITERVGEKNIYELTGATRDRAKPVGEFQNKKGAALMLVSLRAGGTGITLTSADYVFIADPWWNPAVEEQAIDRVHRIGRRGDVFVYRLVAENSVEQRVRALQNKKRMLFEDLLGGLKDVSANSKFIETIKDILE